MSKNIELNDDSNKRTILHQLNAGNFRKHKILRIKVVDVNYYSIYLVIKMINRNPGKIKQIIFSGMPRNCVGNFILDKSKIDIIFDDEGEFYDYEEYNYVDDDNSDSYDDYDIDLDDLLR